MQVTYKFTWNGLSSGSYSVGPVDAKDAHAAWFAALHGALLSGWTPPQWWQWWRWKDYPRSVKPPAWVVKSYFAQGAEKLTGPEGQSVQQTMAAEGIQYP